MSAWESERVLVFLAEEAHVLNLDEDPHRSFQEGVEAGPDPHGGEGVPGVVHGCAGFEPWTYLTSEGDLRCRLRLQGRPECEKKKEGKGLGGDSFDAHARYSPAGIAWLGGSDFPDPQ